MAEPSTYDPNGEAAIWEKAARLVASMKRDPDPNDTLDPWNTAITQAARALETEGRKIRQANGMYYRVLDGSGEQFT